MYTSAWGHLSIISCVQELSRWITNHKSQSKNACRHISCLNLLENMLAVKNMNAVLFWVRVTYGGSKSRLPSSYSKLWRVHVRATSKQKTASSHDPTNFHFSLSCIFVEFCFSFYDWGTDAGTSEISQQLAALKLFLPVDNGSCHLVILGARIWTAVLGTSKTEALMIINFLSVIIFHFETQGAPVNLKNKWSFLTLAGNDQQQPDIIYLWEEPKWFFYQSSGF